MWQHIGADNVKWVLVNEQGRIIARIHLKDGEYRASKLMFDQDGVGTKSYLGAYFSLEQAKAAIEV